jgi:hypothetical protein
VPVAVDSVLPSRPVAFSLRLPRKTSFGALPVSLRGEVSMSSVSGLGSSSWASVIWQRSKKGASCSSIVKPFQLWMPPSGFT